LLLDCWALHFSIFQSVNLQKQTWKLGDLNVGLLDLVKEIGLESKKSSSTNGGEFSSPCPDCGGHDRFRMWPNQRAKNCVGTYWCRQCGKYGDAIQFAIDFFGLSFKDAVTKIGTKVPAARDYRSKVERSFVAPKLTPPSERWSQRALDFVSWAHDQIQNMPEILLALEKRGLPPEAIRLNRIGYCDRNIFVNPDEFGMISDKKLFFPQGIVIPSLEPSGQVVRLKIRRTKWTREDQLPKYWAVRGSMNGLNIIGDVRNSTVVVVESELDAFALHHSAGTLLFTIAAGSNTKNPDNVVDYWAGRRRLLICHDNDEGGLAMNDKWRRLYPHSLSTPVPVAYGKDIGEAVQQGLNLKAWVNDTLTRDNC
jgi:DNA primase